METYLVHFGYVALFVGTFLEGETILLIAAFLAHRGFFSLSLVILIAGCGTLLGDQFAFFLGKSKGVRVIEKRPKLRKRLIRAEELIHEHKILIILTFRFFYGLRNIIPLSLGIFNVSPVLFIPLNILASFVWATVISLAGFYFGTLATAMFHRIANYEIYFMVAVLIIGILFWIGYWYKTRKSS